MDKIYLLITAFPYEGGLIHGAYTSKVEAEHAAFLLGYEVVAGDYDQTFIEEITINEVNPDKGIDI